MSRRLAAAFVALPFAMLACGFDEVGTKEPDAPEAGVHVTPHDGGPTAEPDSAGGLVSVPVGHTDAGAAATCRLSGASCSKTTDCCGTLACTTVDEEKKCR